MLQPLLRLFFMGKDTTIWNSRETLRLEEFLVQVISPRDRENRILFTPQQQFWHRQSIILDSFHETRILLKEKSQCCPSALCGSEKRRRSGLNELVHFCPTETDNYG